MNFTSTVYIVAAIFLFTFALNLLFGYFRGRQKKYSVKWFLYIHLPIPFVVLARVFSHLDYRYIPIFIFAAVIGQIFGARLEF